MPLVHKFFKHFSSMKSGTDSSFRIFGSREGGGSSWRRLLLGKRSSSSEASSSRKFFSSKDSGLSKDSGSNAPRIGTLHMTRASLMSAKRESSSAPWMTTEKDLPTTPSLVHEREDSRRPLSGVSNNGNRYVPKTLEREKNVTPARREAAALEEGRIYNGMHNQSWEHHECSTSESQMMNQTKRARYDL